MDKPFSVPWALSQVGILWYEALKERYELWPDRRTYWVGHLKVRAKKHGKMLKVYPYVSHLTLTRLHLLCFQKEFGWKSGLFRPQIKNINNRSSINNSGRKNWRIQSLELGRLVFHLEKNRQKESLPPTIEGKKKVVPVQIPRSHVGPTVT